MLADCLMRSGGVTLLWSVRVLRDRTSFDSRADEVGVQ